MKKRLLLVVLLLSLLFSTTAYAATTNTFVGGTSIGGVEGSGTIKIDVSNITSQKKVVISEQEALEYFDKAESLNNVVNTDDEGDVTLKDVLSEYNAAGGVPVYYADAGPVTLTAETPVRYFYFSYKSDVSTHTFEPKYYNYDELFDSYYTGETATIYDVVPEGYWVFAEGTKATFNEPGKYIVVLSDLGEIFPSPSGLFCVHIGDTASNTPVDPQPAKIEAKPTASTVLVNSIPTEFEAYNINGNNYFKLRDLAQAVNNTPKSFEVEWDGAKNAINLISKTTYTPAGGELAKGDSTLKEATPTTSTIYKDGQVVELTAYNINGNNFFKLRDIAKAFDIGVTWDGATNTVGIDTSVGYVEE